MEGRGRGGGGEGKEYEERERGGEEREEKGGWIDDKSYIWDVHVARPGKARRHNI